MATLPHLFTQYLEKIRPPDEIIEEYIDGHETLREQLRGDDMMSEFYVSDFLQGSYRRSTAVRPIGDKNSDVDIVLVTNLDKNDFDPAQAMDKCKPFLNEHYEGKWDPKHRAFGIELDDIELDLVLTAAPSEAMKEEFEQEDSIGSLSVNSALEREPTEEMFEELGFSPGTKSEDWKIDPLDIPDRERDVWEKTHPLYTIAWTFDKGHRTNGHYVNVVKTIKWWRRTQVLEPKRPKGYPLEHIVGTCCPDGIESVAEGVTRTFEHIAQRFAVHADHEEAPSLMARGLPNTDVLENIEGEDFAAFHANVVDAANTARNALDEEDRDKSCDYWQSLLGDKFPEYGVADDDDEDDSNGEYQSTNFRSSSKSTNVSDQRFA